MLTEKELMKVGTAEKFQKIFNSLQLTDRQKEIFLLKYGRGMVNTDISAHIGYCRKTVSDEISIIRDKMGQLKIDLD